MSINPITWLLIVLFIFPLIKGYFYKFSSKNAKRSVIRSGVDIAFIIALFSGSYISRGIFIEHNQGILEELYYIIPSKIMDYIQSSDLIIYLVIIPMTIYLIYKIINYILHNISVVLIFPILDLIEANIRPMRNVFKQSIGCLFQLPRAFLYVLTISFSLNIYSMMYKPPIVDNYLQESLLYNIICREALIPIMKSTIAANLTVIINNSFKIQIKNINQYNTMVYYNGTTLEEGIKSNDEIDNMAKQITSGSEDTYTMAKEIYNWVGQNINYDNKKADLISNYDFNVISGAINTFRSKKGICFDYACLYVAMCRSNNIQVRLITGEGFNGVTWVGHAWNQVYLVEENRWINVDTTFSQGGNYFDTKMFKIDHKDATSIGEW